MRRALTTVILLTAIAVLTPGCSIFGGKRKPKSSARIYEGDSPSIRITEEQSAGGKLRPYR